MSVALTDALVARLLDSPAGRAAAAAETEAALATRRELATTRARVIAVAEKTAPLRQSKRAAADATVAAARKALTDAQRAQADVYLETGNETRRSDQQQAALERQLRASCSPLIGQALEELQDMADKARTRGTEATSELTGETDANYGRRVSLSTRPSVEAHMLGIRDARNALQLLELEALDDGALQERIAAIKAGIPTVRFQEMAA